MYVEITDVVLTTVVITKKKSCKTLCFARLFDFIVSFPYKAEP